MKRPLAEIYADLDDVTDRLSSQVRALSLGVLALTWLFLSGNDDVPKSVSTHMTQLKLISVCCVLALLADLMQYVFGYWSTYRVVRAAERSKQREASFDSKSFPYRARRYAFYIKIAMAIIAAVWVVLLIAWSLG